MNGWRQDITAGTRLVALLGHPVGHSRSPAIHNAAFQQAGLDLAYLAFDVHPDELPEAVEGLRALGFAGANVTIPHKERVMPLLDRLDGLAARVGAVNTIVAAEGRALVGHNTDVGGFLAGLEAGWGRPPEGASCLVLGAGGAARAVVAGLLDAAAGRVFVYNRTAERARRLCAEAGTWGAAPCTAVSLESAAQLVPEVDVLVNATPWGLESSVKLTGIPTDTLHEGQVVMDLVYGPDPTPLVERARRRGAITIDGSEMLVRQAAQAFELWTGVPAPVDLMRRQVIG